MFGKLLVVLPALALAAADDMQGFTALRLPDVLQAVLDARSPPPATPMCTINSPVAVRVRQCLDIPMAEARMGFAKVTADARSPVFVGKLSYKTAFYKAIDQHTFVTSSLDGGFVEFHRKWAGTDRCCRNSVDIRDTESECRLKLECFGGLEQDKDGKVYFFLGFDKCEPASKDVSPAKLNYMCNENLMVHAIMNAKRFACLIRNHRSTDPMARCKGLGFDPKTFRVDDSPMLVK